MKNNGTIAVIGITAAVTVVAAMTAPSVIHQIAVFAGGTFAVVSALAVCVVLNIGSKLPAETKPPTPDESIVLAVRALRAGNFSDWAISQTLKLDIDVVSTIK